MRQLSEVAKLMEGLMCSSKAMDRNQEVRDPDAEELHPGQSVTVSGGQNVIVVYATGPVTIYADGEAKKLSLVPAGEG
jgi:hypothetical protein